MAATRHDVIITLIDLRNYSLPFLDEAIPPAARKSIDNPEIKRWSDTINSFDAFIIVTPEYNAGYPGVLKNALDSLYREWNNKPVGLIGYSGGPSGGTSALAQLHAVTQRLKMKPVSDVITIAYIEKALDTSGNFINKDILRLFNVMLDQVTRAVAK